MRNKHNCGHFKAQLWFYCIVEPLFGKFKWPFEVKVNFCRTQYQLLPCSSSCALIGKCSIRSYLWDLEYALRHNSPSFCVQQLVYPKPLFTVLTDYQPYQEMEKYLLESISKVEYYNMDKPAHKLVLDQSSKDRTDQSQSY